MRGEPYEEGKIFVGGLSQDTTKESMRRHFSAYGNITDCVVMIDNATSRSRGFGFVTFDNAEAIDGVLATKQLLDGKEVDCKRACPRDTVSHGRDSKMNSGSSNTFRTEKIFVGGLPDITTEEFKLYFEKFGRVVDAVLMTDKASNRPRGFGFVTFESPDVVEEVVRQYDHHFLRGKWVEVKKAQPKEQMSRGGRSSMGGGSYYNNPQNYHKWGHNAQFGMDRRPNSSMYSMYNANHYYDQFPGDGYGGDAMRGGRSDYTVPYVKPAPGADGYVQNVPAYANVAGNYGIPPGNRPYNTPAPFTPYDNMPPSNGSYNAYSSNQQYTGLFAGHGPQRGNRTGMYGRSYPY